VVTCQPTGVYATAYERPGEGLLMFISNLTDRDADATVTWHTDKLHWKDVSKVWDALTRETIAADHGAIRLQLAPWAYRVVRAKPEARN
jgi:hypothetical protein